MNLKDYYNQNIKENEYHYRFNKIINKNSYTTSNDNNDFCVYDVEEAIAIFKQLCQPEEEFKRNENKIWFYLISYYLHNEGYVIKEFPKLLARPPIEPNDFTYKEIRRRIISLGRDDNGTVRYATRRDYVDSLTFELKNVHLNLTKDIEQMLTNILNHSTRFYEMNKDEQLFAIAGVIEHLLKEGKKYIKVDFQNSYFSFITNENVEMLRKQLHCFRHTSKESIKERQSYTIDQKKALVDYGVAIVNIIYSIVEGR